MDVCVDITHQDEKCWSVDSGHGVWVRRIPVVECPEQ